MGTFSGSGSSGWGGAGSSSSQAASGASAPSAGVSSVQSSGGTGGYSTGSGGWFNVPGGWIKSGTSAGAPRQAIQSRPAYASATKLQWGDRGTLTSNCSGSTCGVRPAPAYFNSTPWSASKVPVTDAQSPKPASESSISISPQTQLAAPPSVSSAPSGVGAKPITFRSVFTYEKYGGTDPNSDLGRLIYSAGVMPAGEKPTFALPTTMNAGDYSRVNNELNDNLNDPSNQQAWLGDRYIQGDYKGNFNRMQNIRYDLEAKEASDAWFNRPTMAGPLGVANPHAAGKVDYSAVSSLKAGTSADVSSELWNAVNDYMTTDTPNSIITGKSENNPYFTIFYNPDGSQKTYGQTFMQSGVFAKSGDVTIDSPARYIYGTGGQQYINAGKALNFDSSGNYSIGPASSTNSFVRVSSAIDSSSGTLPSELSGPGFAGTKYFANQPSGKIPSFDPSYRSVSSPSSTTSSFWPTWRPPTGSEILGGRRDSPTLNGSGTPPIRFLDNTPNLQNPLQPTQAQTAVIGSLLTFPPLGAALAFRAVTSNIKAGKEKGINAYEGLPILNDYSTSTKTTAVRSIINPITGYVVPISKSKAGPPSTKRTGLRIS